MLKMELFDCAINEKCCSADGGRGICPFLSSPPRGVWQLKSPHPWEFAIQCKKTANAWGSARGRGLGVGAFDWCIIFEWNFLHRVDCLNICTPKKQQKSSITFKALHHSRIGLENKFLENKSGRIFWVRQFYFTNSCQQIWGCVNQPFILFIHHIWGETVLFIIQTSDRIRYFTIF